MRQKIRPMFRLLMHLDFVELLEKAISINVVCDGKQFGAQHTVGTVVCIYIREDSAETKDFFGNSIPVYKVLRMPMCLQQAPNKIAVDVVTVNKEKYVQQSPFLCLRSLVLSFAHHIFTRFGYKLAIQLDAAADNRDCGNLQRSMDSMSNPNSMHECIMVTRSVCPAVEADLKTDGMLDILTQFQAGIDLPTLTANLRVLRLAQRYLKEATVAMKTLRNQLQKEEKAKRLKTTAATASPAHSAQPSPETAVSVCADSDGDQKGEQGMGRLTDAQRLEKLVEAVEGATQAVTEANATLAADCAASLAKHKVETGLGMGIRERPMELDVSGPVMRRPDDVRRIFNLYEEKLNPRLELIRRIRWIARRWYCKTQDRAAAKVADREPASAEPPRLPRSQWAKDLEPALKLQWTKELAQELELRIRKMRKLKFERWGSALYCKQAQPGQVGPVQDWKCCHLVPNAEDPKIDMRRWKSMFKKQRGQLKDNIAGTVVSMRENPARFWPCRDQRVSVSSADSAAQSAGSSQGHAGAATVADPLTTELHHVGHVQQCCYHSQHNALNDFIKLLDLEFMQRVVSVIKLVKNPFVDPELRTAIDHLFSEDPELRHSIDSKTDYFKLVRQGIEEQAARGEGISLKEAKEEMGCDLDKDFSAESAHTCAIVRWATVAKSATWLLGCRRAVSFGLLYIAGLGLTTEDEIKAAVAIFSHEGFVSEQHQSVRLEPKVSEAFEFLVVPRPSRSWPLCALCTTWCSSPSCSV